MAVVVIVCIEAVLGLTIIYTGMVYPKFDAVKAREMLDLIMVTNTEHYRRIGNDTQYMKEFRKQFTTHGNETMVVMGMLLFSFSILCVIPAALVWMTVNPVAASPPPAAKTETGEEATTV